MKPKRILTVPCILLAAVFLLSLSACGTASNTTSGNSETPSSSPPTEDRSDTSILPAEQSVSEEDSGGKILIAYFAVAENSEVDAISSASVLTDNGEAKGIVRALADRIQGNVGGDFLSIKTSVAYPADIGPLIDFAAEEQKENVRPALTSRIENLEDYDTIFIGYPNWWYDLPMVMYSFFDEYDFAGKTIVPFCTHNGSGFSSTIQTIQELEPEAEVITDGFTVNNSRVSDAGEDVAQWLKEIGYLD